MNSCSNKVRSRRPMAGLAAVLMGLLATQARSESRDHEQDLQFFERRIRPALVTHCYECHSASSKKVGGKLYLDHAGGLLRGGESGSAIVPGRPGESLFIRAIRKENDDLVMPPDDKPSLPEAVVNDLVEWVRRGAPDPRASPGEKSPRDAQPNGAALWSFLPVDKQPPLGHATRTGPGMTSTGSSLPNWSPGNSGPPMMPHPER